jgi:hypothetical protein
MFIFGNFITDLAMSVKHCAVVAAAKGLADF